MKQANADAHLIRRLGRPEEIASMVTYFFRQGAFLTGLTYPVDGGWSVKGNLQPWVSCADGPTWRSQRFRASTK